MQVFTYIHSSSITPSDGYTLSGLPEWNNGVETVVISLLSFPKHTGNQLHSEVKKPISLIYRVSQEEGTKLLESVPYVKIYRYNPKHLYPKLNGYGDNVQRSLKL